jgi:hypothetical protein
MLESGFEVGWRKVFWKFSKEICIPNVGRVINPRKRGAAFCGGVCVGAGTAVCIGVWHAMRGLFNPPYMAENLFESGPQPPPAQLKLPHQQRATLSAIQHCSKTVPFGTNQKSRRTIAIPTQEHLFLTCFKDALACVTNARNTSGICCALCLAITPLKPAINRCS